MAFANAWVETDPDGSVITVSQLDNSDRLIKQAVRERLEGDPATPDLTGLIEVGSFSAAPKPRKGAARVYVDTAANIVAFGATKREDGRLAVASDTRQLYHVATAAVVTVKIAAADIISGPLAVTALTVTSGGLLFIASDSGGNSALDFGRQDGTPSTPFMDFHSGAVVVDYDVRISVSGGTGAIGGGNFTVTANIATISNRLNVGGNLGFTTAVSRIEPGATSFSIRNNANSADNLIILDAGGATFRSTLTITGALSGVTTLALSGAQSGGTTLSLAGPITLTTAVSKIIPGATSLSLRNNADSADNFIITNVGNATIRSDLTIQRTLLVVPTVADVYYARFLGGSITVAPTNMIDVAVTWNNAALTNSIYFANLTDTASAAASTLMDLQVSSLSKFAVRKDGQVTLAGNLVFAAAASVVIPGATSFTIKNNAGNLFNFQIIDAGAGAQGRVLIAGSGDDGVYACQINGGLKCGAIALLAPSATIIGGITSISLRNNADTADNLLVTNAGVITTRQELRVVGETGGLAGANTITGTSDLTGNSTGVGTIKFKGATSRDSVGFIKIFVGVVAHYVPVFTAITG